MEQREFVLFRLFSENSITLGVLLEERPGAGDYIIKSKA